MTLDTRMYVHDKCDPGLLFGYFRELLGAGPQHPIRDEATSIGHPLGIGLPALVTIDHSGKDAPLRADGDACHEYCEPDADEPYHYHKPAHWLVVSMDTTCAYRDEQGRGCGDLHACYVAQLGAWLDERGIAWSWENEFDGTIHGGAERYERLTDLMQSGHRAMEWFESAVLPAIQGHAKP